MSEIGLWAIEEGAPTRLQAGSIDLEQRLETWIERDTSLLRPDLRIVGRQVTVEGGRVDLLALDPQGRFVVIEIKSGNLRREAVAQALDYASCLAAMPFDELAAKVDPYLAQQSGASTPATLAGLLQGPGEEGTGTEETREVEICIVGTGRSPGLERMVDYLASQYGIPVSSVVYQVFLVGAGQQVLVRQLAETEVTVSPSKKTLGTDDILTLADGLEVGADFRAIHACAVRNGLYPRPYKRSIMYTPPSNKTRMLFTVWALPPKGHGLDTWVSPKAFGEFFGVATEEATRALGEEGPRVLAPGSAPGFVASLDQFFTRVTGPS
jgi:hypothetical protein